MGNSPYVFPIVPRRRIMNGVTLSAVAQTATFATTGAANIVLDAVYTGASGVAITFSFTTDNSDSQTGINIGTTDLSAGTIRNLSLVWTTTAVNDKIRFVVPFVGRNTVVSVVAASGGTLILSAAADGM